MTVRYATEHRCGVAVSGPGLSDAISGTDPLKDNLPLQVCRGLDAYERVHARPVQFRFAAVVQVVRPLDDSVEAGHTADVVNELSAVMCDKLAVRGGICRAEVLQGSA